MNKVLCCFFLILFTCAQLPAQDREWNLLLTDGKELLDVTPMSISSDSLLFRSAIANSSGVQISEIRKVKYREGQSQGGKGFIIGLLSGGAVGFVSGLIADGVSRGDPLSRSGPPPETDYKLIFPAVGGVVGGVTGLVIGAGSGRRSIDMSSMNGDEKRMSLTKLLNPGYAQPVMTPTPQRDVVYLRNGSIVKGAILDMIPDSTLRIITADSSLFVFRMSEIERVAKESGSVPSTQSSRRVEQRRSADELYDAQRSESRNVRFGFHVGGGFPVGEFASTTERNGGAAKGGVVFAGDLDYSTSKSVHGSPVSSLHSTVSIRLQ